MNTNSRKDKYVAKAISILKQEGFRLSLDEMATKMGITKKALYNNFSSKEELLKEQMTINLQRGVQTNLYRTDLEALMQE